MKNALPMPLPSGSPSGTKISATTVPPAGTVAARLAVTVVPLVVLGTVDATPASWVIDAVSSVAAPTVPV